MVERMCAVPGDEVDLTRTLSSDMTLLAMTTGAEPAAETLLTSGAMHPVTCGTL